MERAWQPSALCRSPHPAPRASWVRDVPELPAGPGSGRWAAGGPRRRRSPAVAHPGPGQPLLRQAVSTVGCLHGATFWVSAATTLAALALRAPSAWARFMQTHLIGLLSLCANVVHAPALFPKPPGPHTVGAKAAAPGGLPAAAAPPSGRRVPEQRGAGPRGAPGAVCTRVGRWVGGHLNDECSGRWSPTCTRGAAEQ